MTYLRIIDSPSVTKYATRSFNPKKYLILRYSHIELETKITTCLPSTTSQATEDH